MSVLNKVPFINGVLGHLSSEELQELLDLMNGSGNRTEFLRTMNYPAGNRTNITVADKGIHRCSLQVGPTLYSGYLLYTDDECVLLSFTDFQTILILNIDVAKKWFEVIAEYLDINELRGRVNDLLAVENSGSKLYKHIIGTPPDAIVIISDSGTAFKYVSDVTGCKLFYGYKIRSTGLTTFIAINAASISPGTELGGSITWQITGINISNQLSTENQTITGTDTVTEL